MSTDNVTPIRPGCDQVVQSELPTLLQVLGRLSDLEAFLKDHRAALQVCWGALSNNDDGVATDVAETLDGLVIIKLSEEIESLKEFIAELPDPDEMRLLALGKAVELQRLLENVVAAP